MKKHFLIFLILLSISLSSIADGWDVHFIEPAEGTMWMVGTNVTMKIQSNAGGSFYDQIYFYDDETLITSFYWEGLVNYGLNEMEIYLGPDTYPASDNYIVSFGAIGDPVAVSDVFSIIEMQNITQILNPNEETYWYEGNMETIDWLCYNAENVKIEYSTDNGANWTMLESSYPISQDGYNYYEWQIDVPGMVPGQTYNSLIKITDADNPLDFLNSEQFILKKPLPQIAEVLTPVEEGWWFNNNLKRISWNSYAITSVDIEYSINGGTDWIIIATEINRPHSGPNSFFWQIPDDEFDGVYSNSQIRIKEHGNETNFALSPVFTLANVPQFKFLNPGPSTTWEVGTTEIIKIQNNSNKTLSSLWLWFYQGAAYQTDVFEFDELEPGLNEYGLFIEPGVYFAYDNYHTKAMAWYGDELFEFYSEPFAITGEQPEISTSVFSLHFGDIQIGETSGEQSFTVQANYLIENLTVEAPGNFEISLTSGTGFGNTITLEQANGTVPETGIFVRFSPDQGREYNESIENMSNYILSKYIEVIGFGIE